MSTISVERAFGEQEDDWELQRPEGSAIDLALAGAVALLAVLLAKPFFSYNPLGSDEGIAFQGAMRILKGEVPYRDFFSFYTPGSYYLYAAMFWMFGASMQVARTLLVAYAGLFSLLTYLLARRTCSRAASFFAASLLALICLPSRFENLHSWDSTVTALLAVYSAVWFLQTNAKRWAFLAGFLTGCTAMIEQTRGAGMILGLALAALLLRRFDRERWALRSFYPAGLGSLIPFLIVVTYFAAHHALTAMFAGWFWPLHHYTAANTLPYGYMFWSRTHILGQTSLIVQMVFALALSATFLISFLPIATLALGSFVTGRVACGYEKGKPLHAFVVLLTGVLLGNLSAAIATGRADYLRIIYLAPLFFFAFPLLLDKRLVHLPHLSLLRPLLVLYMIVSFAECWWFFSSRARGATQVLSTRRGVVRVESDELISYVRACVPAGAKVLFYPYEATYSFLTATYSPLRYDFLQPGMHTSAQFEEARQELEGDKTRVVVFDLTFISVIPEVWPSTPASALANDPMGDYILANYRVCRILQSRRRPFAYMVRRDLPCPGASSN